jgi:hypothetical protein
VHLDAVPDEFRGDVGLQVRKAEHEVGFEREDLVDLRADERGDLRFLLARTRRAHREAGNADDAVFLAHEVQRFGRLLGQADDAGRVTCFGSATGRQREGLVLPVWLPYSSGSRHCAREPV